MTTTFSQFQVGGAPVAGDIIVGLRAGVNTQFNVTSTQAASSLEILINYPGHGFLANQVIAATTGGNLVLGNAASYTTARVVGIVSNVVDVNNFYLTTQGAIGGFVGLTPFAMYFLSDTIAGTLTNTPVITMGHISKPLMIAITTTEGILYNFRGQQL